MTGARARGQQPHLFKDDGYISHDDRDALGNGSFTTITGYDCDRDGKVDDPPKCAILFEMLKKHYQKQ